jgi:hypothetical protein
VAAMSQAAAASGNRDADIELAAAVLDLGYAARPARPRRSVARAGRLSSPGGRSGNADPAGRMGR